MSAGVEASSSGSLVDPYPAYACSPSHAVVSSMSEYPSSSSSMSSVKPPEVVSGVASVPVSVSLRGALSADGAGGV